VYQALKSAVGVPSIHWYGIEHGCNILVMDLLGPSLEDLLTFCRHRFSMKTVLMLADQMIQRVEHLHDQGYIHGDIKPDNFVIGLGQWANCVHLIDLGLATRYRDPDTSEHVAFSCHAPLSGTPIFASINAHLGVVKSRRDDLESLGYTLMYFLSGSLPWQGLRAESRKDWSKILASKISLPLEVLCKTAPSELYHYMSYCRKLRFDDAPDYEHLRDVMHNWLVSNMHEHDFVFDWTLACLGKDVEKKEPMQQPSKCKEAEEAKGEEVQVSGAH